MLIIMEKTMNLFDVPQGYYLAHCISSDFTLGAGIATQFVDIYNMKEKLFAKYESDESLVGKALLIDNVFNLVTKNKVWHKPTYESLRNTLEDMNEKMLHKGITKIAMPEIGCGLDQLDFSLVKEIIEEVFENEDVEILICHLPE